MKVLEVVHGFPPAAQGGTELYALAHAGALHGQHGDEVLVLTREHDRSRPEYSVRTELREGLRIVWVNNTFSRTRTFEETYRNESIGAIADRAIEEFGPDVAHIHHLTYLSTTIVRSLAARRIPSFLTLHDYWLMCHRGQLLDLRYRACDGPGSGNDGCHACLGPAGGAGVVGFAGLQALRAVEQLSSSASHGLRHVAERVAALTFNPSEAEDQERKRIAHMRDVCRGITHFLAPSRHMRDRFVEFGIPPERISVSPYGVRHGVTVVAPDVPRESAPCLRLGFVGTLMVSKGAHVLLDAIARFPDGAISVDVFGACTDYHGDDSYRRRLAPLADRANVRLHGAVAHEQVLSALASIDVLVVPSIWPENSPFAIHEAFLAGVPVIASRTGGIPEIVVDGRNGLLFEAGDPDDLSRALARVLEDPTVLGTLRAGIVPPRSLDDDVRFARGLYRRHTALSVRSSVHVNRMAAVVLNFRTPDQTLLAVKSLLASRRPVDDLIVVNNDSGDDTRDVLGTISTKTTYLHTGSNLGFSGGMNVGIRRALSGGADRVLLVNSDVIVPPDAVERLEASLDAVPDAGIAGPVILARSEPNRVASLGMSWAPLTGRMRHRGHGQRVAAIERAASGVVDGVSGCAMLIRREVFEAVGLLDEDYFFSFEDLDLCLRARRAGFKTVLAGSATVYHEGGRSLGARSARRLYFAARNHLLLAQRAAPSAGRLASMGRVCSIVLLNLAHAVRSPGGSPAERLVAVAHGTRDYMTGRLGSGL